MKMQKILVILVLCLMAQSASAQVNPRLLYIPGIDIIYKTTSEKGDIYLSETPAPRALADLKAMGIKTLVSLGSPSDVPLDMTRVAKNHGMIYKNIPITVATLDWKYIKRLHAHLSQSKNYPVIVYGPDFQVVLAVMAIEWVEKNQATLDEAIRTAKKMGLREQDIINRIRSFVRY